MGWGQHRIRLAGLKGKAMGLQGERDAESGICIARGGDMAVGRGHERETVEAGRGLWAIQQILRDSEAVEVAGKRQSSGHESPL